jgi:hypothetical protein
LRASRCNPSLPIRPSPTAVTYLEHR